MPKPVHTDPGPLRCLLAPAPCAPADAAAPEQCVFLRCVWCRPSVAANYSVSDLTDIHLNTVVFFFAAFSGGSEFQG